MCKSQRIQYITFSASLHSAENATRFGSSISFVFVLWTLNIVETAPDGLQVPLAGWIQIFGYAAYCEISAGYDADITKRTPGDMGWNPPIFSGNDPETKTRRLNAELANGRLAMMATIGMFFQASSAANSTRLSYEALLCT
eukprot:Skav201545  [mRNA]  locus=scaffold1616:175454:175876:+ [translate_table: standard]